MEGRIDQYLYRGHNLFSRSLYRGFDLFSYSLYVGKNGKGSSELLAK